MLLEYYNPSKRSYIWNNESELINPSTFSNYGIFRIHKERITKGIERELDAEEKQLIKGGEFYSPKLRSVLLKFDFLSVIGIEKEFEYFSNQFD